MPAKDGGRGSSSSAGANTHDPLDEGSGTGTNQVRDITNGVEDGSVEESEGDDTQPPPPPLVAFWIMGLLNNAAYVIMIASAKSISEGGTAAVFLANIVPTLLVKLTAPYWFDRVGYGRRMAAASLLMAGSFLVVGHYSREANVQGGGGRHGVVVAMELIGVALGSFQAGLGEASLLALAGRYDSHVASGEKKTGRCITAFSSGTGLAGVFGFAYKVVLTDWMGMSLSSALLAANVLAAAYWWMFRRFLTEEDDGDGAGEGSAEEGHRFREVGDSERRLCSPRAGIPVGSERGVELHLLHDGSDDEEAKGAESSDFKSGSSSDGGLLSKMKGRRKGRRGRRRGYTGLGTTDDAEGDSEASSSQLTSQGCSESGGAIEVAVAAEMAWSDDDDGNGGEADAADHLDIKSLSTCGRLRLTLSLWPYMVPLFTVYAAEYALQSGTWTAIGFPVDSVQARDKFYEYSNWMYQAGVFVSRSSGTLFTASIPFLWLMPFLQCVNLAFFYRVASTQSSLIFGYDFSLLAPCFYTGLLGGAVYVNAYNRMCADLPTIPLREFALSAASVADSFGIVAADIGGLFIQSCLYAKNGIDGAVVKCPLGG